MKQIPNILTILRVFLTLGFLFFITKSGLSSVLIAIAIFAVASVTDYYDGYYAKKYNVVSDFGKIMDPIADKFLILAALFIFTRMNLISNWMFGLIFVREFIVTGSRFIAMKKGSILAAESAGKYKTVSQIVVIFFILFFIAFNEAGVFKYWPASLRQLWDSGIYLLMLITVGLTLGSGFSYFWNNREVF